MSELLHEQAGRLAPFLDWLEAEFPRAHPLLVGGAVRDAQLGRTSQDLDLEVLGLSGEDFESRVPWPIRRVGKSYDLWLVELPELGWVELSLEAESVPRDWQSHWGKLCRRRDFSCNTLAWDPRRQELLDPLRGVEDIQRRQLRLASPTSLSDDPLRLWRAAQFCARFGWSPEAEFEAAVPAALEGLQRVAAERVTREWEKLLRLAEHPGDGLEWLRRWGVLARFEPELEALVGCPQDPQHHPEGDVWTHTRLVVDQAAALARREGLNEEEHLRLMLAALLHDLGKPATTRREGLRVTAHGHEGAGVAPARAWLERRHFHQDIEEAVLVCVSEHMRPSLLTREILEGKLSPSQRVNALRRLVRDVQRMGWKLFILVCEADKRGRGMEIEEFVPARVLGELMQEHPVQQLAEQPLLLGRDVLALGVPAGPEVGRWIRRVEEQRDEGLLHSREQALDWLRLQVTGLTGG